jgi:hypothetical protein
MTIRYKSETFDLTTTNVTTILTCPADATIIGKSLQKLQLPLYIPKVIL